MDENKSDPLEITVLDCLNNAKKFIEESGNDIHGIIICIKMENDSKISCPDYFTGGGLTALEAMGTLEYAKCAIYEVSKQNEDLS